MAFSIGLSEEPTSTFTRNTCHPNHTQQSRQRVVTAPAGKNTLSPSAWQVYSAPPNGHLIQIKLIEFTQRKLALRLVGGVTAHRRMMFSSCANIMNIVRVSALSGTRHPLTSCRLTTDETPRESIRSVNRLPGRRRPVPRECVPCL